MAKRIASILLLVLGGALLLYTASRTLDLLQATLPEGQKDLAFLALAAFDGGLVLWALYFLKGASGGWQRGIAALMILVSLVGVVVAFGADTLMGASASGLATMDKSVTTTAVLATIAIIALNIAAVTACHVMSPENQRAMAEEEAHGKIVDAAIKQIASNAESLASELAPMLGDSWVRDMRARYLQGVDVPALPAARPMVTLASEGAGVSAKKSRRRLD
jgi:hypothetical protein